MIYTKQNDIDAKNKTIEDQNNSLKEIGITRKEVEETFATVEYFLDKINKMNLTLKTGQRDFSFNRRGENLELRDLIKSLYEKAGWVVILNQDSTSNSFGFLHFT